MGWSTTVVHWRMRYSLRRINWPRRDRASGLSPHTPALGVVPCLCFCLCWCVVYCLALLCVFVTHAERPCVGIWNDTAISFDIHIMISFLSRQFFFQAIRYGQHIARTIATRARVWAYIIGVRVAIEVVEEAQRVAAERAKRCVSVSSNPVSANTPQSEHDVHDYRGRVLHRRRQPRQKPRERRIGAWRAGLEGGLPSWYHSPHIGASGAFFFHFFQLESLLTLCRTAGLPERELRS